MKHEIVLQKELTDVINAHEGFAFKLTNRFLVGVPDLFVKMPGFPATLLETKQDKMPIKLQWVLVSLTPLQWRFLKRAFNAGMTACGVVSFVQRDKEFGMCVIPIERFPAPVLKVDVAVYRRSLLIERKSLMLDVLVEHLKHYSRMR